MFLILIMNVFKQCGSFKKKCTVESILKSLEVDTWLTTYEVDWCCLNVYNRGADTIVQTHTISSWMRTFFQFKVSCQNPSDLPEEASSLSNLLISQSNELENWAQFFLFPRISAAEQGGKNTVRILISEVLLLCHLTINSYIVLKDGSMCAFLPSSW